MRPDEIKKDTTDPAVVPAQSPVPAPEAPARERLAGPELLALALGLGLSVLWFYVFSLENIYSVPAWGTTAFVLAALTCEVICLRGRVRPQRDGVFLTVCTVLLAVAPALFPDYRLRLADLAALSFLTPASALALAGRGFPAMSARVLTETPRLFFPGLFRHITMPFRALRRGGKGFRAFWVVVLTLCLLLPVLAAVLALLSSADMVFNSLLGSVGDAILNSLTHADTVWRGVRTVLFGLMLFSFLCSLSRPVTPRTSSTAGSGAPPLPALPFIAGLSALDIIYAVFAAIQIVFLFGGRETAVTHGGYAQYARTGFFQLAAVSAINLAAMLSSVRAGRDSRAVRYLVYILTALTGVILASAVMRMCLYIGAYGLSLLRAATLVIMAWLAAAITLAALKTARPDRRIFPALFALALVLAVVFNYVNIDARIADFNYDAYIDGRVSAYDYGYLASLGPGEDASLPAPCRPLIPNSPPGG